MKSIEKYIIDYQNKYNRLPSFMIRTYGCQMNERDSESISWILSKLGFLEVDDMESADVVIFNTCAVRQNAENKLLGNLGDLKHLMEVKNLEKIIMVCGCVMEIDSSRQFLEEKFKHVDIIFGTNSIAILEDLLEEHLISKKQVVNIDQINLRTREKIGQNRKFMFKSYVNIMYGCDNFCTYCIVPYTRGREISREVNDILSEIKYLVDSGVKEVTLLGQNVNSYGKTLNPKVSFTELIYKIAKIDGLERIRFMTSHPKDISKELIYAFDEVEKLMPFLHIPVQSGSNRILKLMNRKYTREDYLENIKLIKSLKRDIALSTDIIVGFPGESDDDFNDTIDLIEKVGYDQAFTFIYSTRPGTIAAKMNDQIPDDIKNARLQKLIEVQNDISLEKNKKYLGKTLNVLVEGTSSKDDNFYSGRSEEFKLVNFKASDDDIGNIIKVKINDVKSFSLNGEKVEDR